jgi:hypothetical protein
VALLSFPVSPANNDLYPLVPTVGQYQYQWSSADATWRLVGAATGVSAGTYGDSTHVGQFTVNAAGQITFAQDVLIAVTGGTVTQVDTGTGLTGGPITASGTIVLDTAYTDTLYLGLAGGTLTGDVTFAGTQTFPGVLPLAGGTMTGDITFSGTQTFPAQDLQEVTDAGNATTNAIDVAGLTAAGLSYPLVDGTADQVMSTDGAGGLGWLSTLKVVTAPTASADPGTLGEVAVGAGFLYFYDGTQWLQVAGSTF